MAPDQQAGGAVDIGIGKHGPSKHPIASTRRPMRVDAAIRELAGVRLRRQGRAIMGASASTRGLDRIARRGCARLRRKPRLPHTSSVTRFRRGETERRRGHRQLCQSCARRIHSIAGSDERAVRRATKANLNSRRRAAETQRLDRGKLRFAERHALA
jgi:hypothetical protein